MTQTNTKTESGNQNCEEMAIKMCIANGYSEEKALEIVNYIINCPAVSDNKNYVLAVTRWYLEGEIDIYAFPDQAHVSTLLWRFMESFFVNEYDYNFRFKETGTLMTFHEMGQIMMMNFDPTFIGLENASKHYNVKLLQSIDDLKEFKDYLNDWCIAEDEQAFRYYAMDGDCTVYLIYSDNFKDIAKKQGDTFPRDEYGLSVMCVIVNRWDRITLVASRWNSDEEQERLLADAELKQVIGEENFNLLKYKRKKMYSRKK